MKSFYLLLILLLFASASFAQQPTHPATPGKVSKTEAPAKAASGSLNLEQDVPQAKDPDPAGPEAAALEMLATEKIPADFPRFKDYSNKLTYEKKVADWFAANPDKRKKPAAITE